MKHTRLSYKCRILLCMLLLCSVLFSGCLPYYIQSTEQTEPKQSQEESRPEYYEKLDEILAILDEYYVDDYSTEELGDYLASAMIASTGDRWSYYISADEYDAYAEQKANAYVGIGVTIQIDENDDGRLEIIKVAKNSPAQEAGLKIGDYVVAAEGVPVAEIGLEGTQQRVCGEEGTDVTITIERDGEQFDVTITRHVIETEIVVYELLESGDGYIKINNFDSNSARDTIAAIDAMLEQGAKSLIFDLRFNPGGYKHELVKVLDYLLPEGPLFRAVDYQGREEVDYSEASCIDLPMAVLINADTYSAAEFFAAALQEYEAGVVIGTQTSGKANYQQTFRLSDGSAIAISTGHYQTPNGVTLAGVGVTPDVIVEVDDDTYLSLYYEQVEKADDAQLQAAISALKDTE